jgi:hypothetical protein
MIIVALPALLILHGLPIAAAIGLGVIAAFIVWLVDVLTVRLVVAGKWRGLLGCEV